MTGSFHADLSGQVACVSGGATGIGAASARMLARAGARVIIADVNDHAARETVQAITGAGGGARAVNCDVGDEAQVEAAIAGILQHEGRLDIVHANAGLESTLKATEADLRHWERVLNVNLTGVFLVCTTALRHMCERGSGSVIITSSPHAMATVPDAAAYAASKGGVHALMRALALEAAPHGVRVNAIMPGAVDTPMLRREMSASAAPREEQLRRFALMHPLGRLGRPEEVAASVLFLASDAASFITGTALAVDGGLMAALSSGPPLAYGG